METRAVKIGSVNSRYHQGGGGRGGGVTVNPTFSTFFFISYHFIVPHLNYVIQPKITYRGRRKRCYLLIHCLSVGFYFTPVDYLT